MAKLFHFVVERKRDLAISFEKNNFKYYVDYTNLDNLGELYIFKLNKENIKPLIVKYGGYAHGTIGELGEITMEDLNDINNPKEYALRPKYGDKCWIELLNFRINLDCVFKIILLKKEISNIENEITICNEENTIKLLKEQNRDKLLKILNLEKGYEEKLEEATIEF